ncbi:exonuclease domain-containing protein [Aureivirga marina]|uniref:exonuclease domain-containing protein n=1 Tax=Aureivirga marina TaxID=1182451 RepID=UPI0018C90B8B|nr:exonuclease domain-containing protein [Aureivirga marina]
MYAIIDIETTGGKFNEEGITEIAIYKFDGHEIVDQFISLINPEKEIQAFVVNLTGINNKMLRNAPKFYEVAKRIIEITEDCVIVAHNAGFDYRILRTEFSRLGFDYQRQSLCTVELSKQLIPDLPSYSLGKLCRSLGIAVADRHRASGDAMATVKLFKLLLNKDNSKQIIQQNTKNAVPIKKLAPKLQGILESLPTKKGIFYLHREGGSILYIGKAHNIKKAVNQLFLKTTKNAKYMQKKVVSVSFEITGSNLINNLKYYKEVQLNQPTFNSKKKKNADAVIFNNENMLIIDKGRSISERSVILIESQELIGFGYVDLAYQINNLDILKPLLSPLEDSSYNRSCVKKHLDNHKVEKIIRF